MNDIPLVTIGITCFNAENMISRAIQSALGQTYKNIEIIIVDDASIDNSLSKINEIAKNEKRINLICHEVNKGAPSAYNSIINNARGKYICFFDDDDFSHENRVEKTVQVLEQNNTKDLVCYCDRYVVQDDNKKTIIKGLTKTQATSKEAMEHMLDTLCYQYDRPDYRKNNERFTSLKKHNLSGSSAGTGVMTAPTNILKKHLFDTKMLRFCDTELNLRMFQKGVSAINIDKPLLTQYVTTGKDKSLPIEKQSAFYALIKHKKTYHSYGVHPLPLVSIGITCFNAQDSISKAIESALNQTYENLELVIVDDASSDDSVNIINGFIKDNKNIKFSPHSENKGAPSAYNTILEKSSGKYISFFDDDDISHPDRIEKTVLALELADSDNLVCYCDRFVYDNSNSNKKRIVKGLTQSSASSKNIMEHMLDTLLYQYDRSYYRKNQIRFYPLKQHGLTGSSAGSGIMTAPAKILKNLLFDSKMYRFWDTELNLRMFQSGVSAINIDEPLMTQYVTSGMDKTSFIEKESVYHALNKHREIYRSYGIYYPKVFSIDEEFPKANITSIIEDLPLVSIGICTENSEENIFEVVKSALSQTYPNIELIIIDNASSDTTMDILSKIKDSRLNLFRNQTKKMKAENLNQILSLAKGEYTAFFDDKDISLKHRIESHIYHLFNIKSKDPVFELADYYNYIGGFSGVHHCLGSFGKRVDPKTLQFIIWHIVIRHSESKYLLTDFELPFFEYSLFLGLLCGDTKTLKEIGFDPGCPDKFTGLDMLLRFTDKKGGLVTSQAPLLEKYHNPLHSGDWSATVEQSNAFIKLFQDRFENDVNLNVDVKSILHRNQLKAKLLRRFSRIKEFI